MQEITPTGDQTMTTFNTNLTVGISQIIKPHARGALQIWRLLEALFADMPVDPARELARMERREAARRSVDNLLR